MFQSRWRKCPFQVRDVVTTASSLTNYSFFILNQYSYPVRVGIIDINGNLVWTLLDPYQEWHPNGDFTWTMDTPRIITQVGDEIVALVAKTGANNDNIETWVINLSNPNSYNRFSSSGFQTNIWVDKWFRSPTEINLSFPLRS